MIEVDGLRIEGGEQIAIVGGTGSGKSELADRIAFKGAGSVSYIRFRDTYGAAIDKEYFHQQRWNHGVWDDDMPTVAQMLGLPDEATQRLIDAFDLSHVLDKPLITLSSGEIRKYQLTRALKRSPQVLLIDNPFIGLDPQTRSMLSSLLLDLTRGQSLSDTGRQCQGCGTNLTNDPDLTRGQSLGDTGRQCQGCGTNLTNDPDLTRGQSLSVVLVLSRPDEIPDWITHVVEITAPGEWNKQTLKEFKDSHFAPEVIRFSDVSVRYGERTILEHLDWTVRRGEHWALTGQNGSGKSTLLSLVCADNPMAYACHIELFGRKRGTGESIWDIKKRIGYVSPEMHRAYRTGESVLDVVTSGLFDTTGVQHHVSGEQMEVCRKWIRCFGMEHLEQRPFAQLSSGEQRLCLVCRAFVKEPPLLVLDEPMHGLDDGLRSRVRGIIESYCSDPSKTLIMVTHYPEEYPACIDHSLTLTRR